MPIGSLPEGQGFGPEDIRILTNAFEAAWDVIRTSGNPLGDDSHAASTRDLLAQRIIEIGQKGERDNARLVQDAVAYILANQGDS
jgi:hypothetical protein